MGFFDLFKSLAKQDDASATNENVNVDEVAMLDENSFDDTLIAFWWGFK